VTAGWNKAKEAGAAVQRGWVRTKEITANTVKGGKDII